MNPSPHPYTLAVYLSKGGVAKSTLVAVLALYLAGRGQRVVVIDFDRQGSQSALFDLLDATLRGDEVLHLVLKRRVDILAALTPIPTEAIPQIDGCTPGTLAVIQGGPQTELAIDEIAANPVLYRLASTLDILRGALRPLAGQADVVLIDMGPSDQVMAIAGLMAADAVLIPTTVDYLSVVRIVSVLEEIDVVRDIRPELEVLGIVPTMTKYYFGGLRPAKNVQVGKQMLDETYGDLLLTDSKGRTIDLPEHDDWKNAQWAGRSVLTMDVHRGVRESALRFARTIAARMGLPENEVLYGG
jgi:chromosome partitioning protein